MKEYLNKFQIYQNLKHKNQQNNNYKQNLLQYTIDVKNHIKNNKAVIIIEIIINESEMFSYSNHIGGA